MFHQRHVDYVHVNPLKQGFVKHVADWMYSTFYQYVAQGICLSCGVVILIFRLANNMRPITLR